MEIRNRCLNVMLYEKIFYISYIDQKWETYKLKLLIPPFIHIVYHHCVVKTYSL